MADLIESLKTVHQQTEHVVEVLRKACSQLSLTELSTECIQLSATLKDSKQSLTSLRSPEVPVEQLKKYTKEQLLLESAGLEARLSSSSTRLEAEMKEKLKKLETRLMELDCAPSGESRMKGDGGIKKVMNRISDFESQVGSQLQAFTQDVEKKLSFMSSRRTAEEPEDALSRELDALRYDVGELKDLLSGAKGDTAQVKRIVLACERDMEDFTAAMDAVNVDLDEMRARVDSTHSIITSRQRVEATVTAEISTMRLDMGDMQEALKAHDAWMEDVSQSLQEVHERCEGLAEQITTVEHGLKAKLEGKTDIAAWNDMNDDIDQSIRTVRDMASSLRFEVDSRRRRVDEELLSIRAEVSSLEEKMNSKTSELLRSASEQQSGWAEGLEAHQKHSEAIEAALWRHAEQQQVMQSKMDGQKEDLELRLSLLDANVQKQGEELSKSSLERLEALEAQQGRAAGEASKALRAMELRLAALQGASGECRRDLQRLREEANNLTVKSAAHDVDVAKNSDDLRKMERQRVEDDQRHKQEFDAIYEELDSKVAEKSHQRLEENASKLTRGVVKLCQVVGVFPGARMNDGTEEELDVDVELLNWEDCAQHMVVRVEKTWRQLFSQKYRSVLDLVSKKADHSVLRLLQISQQHIESQLDRVRQERELMKEVLERRAMPMQMTLPLKDPNTGMPMQGFGWPMPGLPLYDANGETVKPPPKRVAQRPAGAPAPKAQAATPREVPP